MQLMFCLGVLLKDGVEFDKKPEGDQGGLFSNIAIIFVSSLT